LAKFNQSDLEDLGQKIGFQSKVPSNIRVVYLKKTLNLDLGLDLFILVPEITSALRWWHRQQVGLYDKILWIWMQWTPNEVRAFRGRFGMVKTCKNHPKMVGLWLRCSHYPNL
jgi:hypothetical protein